MADLPVDVAGSGAILLGDKVSCDGFQRDVPIRIQTHIHSDHMDDFDRSKGLQDIYLTPATRRLLIAEFNADLDIRQNLKPIEPGEEVEAAGVRISLLSSGHMLGSAQVAIEFEDGTRLGYSGDFQWPIEPTIQVDGLVVDSTYGSPDTRRFFTQSEVEDRFRDLVRGRLKRGPVLMKAYRGTVQRALQILSGSVDCPLIGSKSLSKIIPIYQEFGYAVGPVLDCESEEGRDALASGASFIRLYGHTDQFPVDPHPASTIHLSAFATNPNDPILEYSLSACRVALTDHADFDGTLAYVEATGAKYVITDNTRAGYAIQLAEELRRRLNIEARPSSNVSSLEWGT